MKKMTKLSCYLIAFAFILGCLIWKPYKHYRQKKTWNERINQPIDSFIRIDTFSNKNNKIKMTK